MTGKDTAGRMADAWVSATPFLVALFPLIWFPLHGSDWVAAGAAALFWSTSDRKGWL